MTSLPAERAGAILEIDLGGIVENWRLLTEKAAPARCAAVVKANGYGLGAGPVARALAAAGCRMLFVATLDEAIALRQDLADAPEIAVLNGPFPGTAGEFVEHRLIPVLNEPGQVEEWEKIGSLWPGLTRGPSAHGLDPWASTKEGVDPRVKPGDDDRGMAPQRVHPAILHVDTGMARLGLSAREFAAVIEKPPPVAWHA